MYVCTYIWGMAGELTLTLAKCGLMDLSMFTSTLDVIRLHREDRRSS